MNSIRFALCTCLVLFFTNAKAQLSSPIENHQAYFLPGAGYTAYFPKGLDTSGYFHGALIEYVFYNGINQDDGWGASHVRFYGKLSIMNPNNTKLSSLFAYTLGLDFSFEKNPKRNVLIPYFGVEMGGLSSKTYSTNFGFYPLIGIRFLALKRLNFGASALYAYPIKEFETFRGWQTQATINFSLW